jgi:hypothetical protein
MRVIGTKKQMINRV